MNTNNDTTEITTEIETENTDAVEAKAVSPFFAKASKLTGLQLRTRIRAGRKQEQNDK